VAVSVASRDIGVTVVGMMSEQAPIPDPVPPQPDCRILSYNVLYEGVGPDGHGWADRREAVTAELARLSPDVVAFQEVWMGQFTDLGDSLSEFSWVAATETPAHTPIAYRTDLFELTESGTLWLAPPDEEPGVPAWDATFQRLSTYATLEDPSSGQSLTVLNVHLDHEGEQARREGIALARERLTERQPDTEVVLAGDFNCQPTDPAYRRATSKHEEWVALSDAASVAHTVGGPKHTYTGFEIEDWEPQNIDHVLVSDGLEVEQAVTCVPPTEPELRPSDHRPVLADISY
jgi:endonuclease/exonuclease/phosphatase family metal-dependent hydrolase